MNSDFPIPTRPKFSRLFRVSTGSQDTKKAPPGLPPVGLLAPVIASDPGSASPRVRMDGEGNMQADGGMAAVEPQPLGGEAADYTNLQRVKVYRLNESGHWDDKGTGHVSCEYMEVR